MDYKYRLRFVGEDEYHTVEPGESLTDAINDMLTQHSPPHPVEVSTVTRGEGRDWGE